MLQIGHQLLLAADQFEMSLEEFYYKVTQDSLRTSAIPEPDVRFIQFGPINPSFSERETVKDSIHLDWRSTDPLCPECGVTVNIWDGFAHRVLWNKTWHNSVAFQPLATRFETERNDSPIEGFVFRLWQWDNPEDTFTMSKWNRKNLATTTTTTTSRTPPSRPGFPRDEEGEDEEEESIFKHSSSDDDDEMDEDDNDYYNRRAPNEWLSNMIPFGHPVLPGRRRTLSVESKEELDYWKKKRRGRRRRLGLVGSDTAAGTVFRNLNVTESVYYATLIHSTPRVVRLFAHQLVQRCKMSSKERKFQCSPHFDESGPRSSKCATFAYHD